MRLVDADQNQNPALAESVLVTLSAPGVRGRRAARSCSRPASSTGIFVGYVPTSAPPAPANDCVLAAPTGQTIAGSYTDPLNGADTDSDTALIDPESRVFDSTTRRAASTARS